MNVLNIEHVSKILGEKVIFEDVSYGVEYGDKIGIVGLNGTGKSTLLKILAGCESADSGQVVMQKGLHISYLPQDPPFPEDKTVTEYVAEGVSRQDWETVSAARNILNHLGFADPDQTLSHMSGGQKKRAALARVLVDQSDILLLDEPTNHIDQEMLVWLEEFLIRYKGVLIMVTHDRYFLDRVTNKIIEISHGSLYGYQSNYSGFLEGKALREEMELASERKRKSILRMELEWAKRGCRARSTKQKARLMRLEALKKGTAPAEQQSVELESAGTRMGKKTVELHHISKSYGENCILQDFDYIFLRNQRVGIIGPNGCGKSTLVKMIAGLVPPDSGNVELGETIRIGYFAQTVPDMDGRQRVIDYIREEAEYIQTGEGKISAAMMLERFLFDPVMQYTPVAKLSGGEKRRLYLLKVLMSAPNVLLLDEPGNDLDIPTLTILEDYISTFSGIVISVSHDRYFLDNVADRIFAFEGAGRLVQYEGGYTDYAQAVMKKNTGEPENEKAPVRTADTAPAKSWKQNRPEKLRFTFKEQREYASIDGEIEALEEQISRLDGEILANATNSFMLRKLMEEQEQAKAQLEKKMERWVYLNELAERIEAQK